MLIKPLKTIGIIGISKLHQIHNLNLKNYAVISNFSSIHQYDVENLKLVKKSPFLHPNYVISNVLMIKNRTFLSINSTLHILDFSIPVTRLKIFNEPISDIIRFKNKIFLFSRIEQQGYVLDSYTLNSLKSLNPINKILFITKTKVSLKKNLVTFYTNEGILEIWNIDLLKNVCSFKFGLSLELKDFYCSYTKENILINFQKKNLLVCNLKKEKKNCVFKNKKFEKFEKSFFIDKHPDFFFIKCKDSFYCIKKNHGIMTKLSFMGHIGKINFVELIKNNLFLTVGFHDNTLAIHCFNKKRGQFNLLKKKSACYQPFRKIQPIRFNKNVSTICKKLKKIQIENSHIIRQKQSLKKLKITGLGNKLIFRKQSTFNSKNVILKQIVVKTDILDSKRYKIAIFFYRNPIIWIFDIFKTLKNIKYHKHIRNQKNLGEISCLSISSKLEVAIIGYQDNFLSFLDIGKGNFLFYGKNHKFFDLRYRCKIKFCELDSSELLFLSYCSHGILNLWSLINLKIQKTLILKGINLISWSTKRDLITVSSNDNKIYLIIPQSFYNIRVLSGHYGKINRILFFKKDRYLISLSTDKTVKIWDLIENKCCDTIKFKYYPMNFQIGKKSDSFYISHENTVGLGKWGLSTKKKLRTNNFLSFFSVEIFIQKETNFTFFKICPEPTLNFPYLRLDQNFFFVTEIKNCFRYNRVTSKKKKILKKFKYFKKMFLLLKNIYGLKLIYHKFLKKVLKKVMIWKIKMLNTIIKIKNKLSIFFVTILLVFSKEFFFLNFILIEEFNEIFIWKNFRYENFPPLSYPSALIFERLLGLSFHNLIYRKLLIDVINLF